MVQEWVKLISQGSSWTDLAALKSAKDREIVDFVRIGEHMAQLGDN